MNFGVLPPESRGLRSRVTLRTSSVCCQPIGLPVFAPLRTRCVRRAAVEISSGPGASLRAGSARSQRMRTVEQHKQKAPDDAGALSFRRIPKGSVLRDDRTVEVPIYPNASDRAGIT